MRWLGLLLCAGLAASAGQSGKQAKRAPQFDVQVVEISTHRDSKHILMDGRLRNSAGKPLRGLVVFIEFLESGKKMISRMQTVVVEGEMAPGEEGEFHVQSPDQVRAVYYLLEVEDTQGRYLRLDKPGPYVIE